VFDLEFFVCKKTANIPEKCRIMYCYAIAAIELAQNGQFYEESANTIENFCQEVASSMASG